MAEYKHSKYLHKDGESVKLFLGDEIEEAMKDGWKEPDFSRSNGEPWNPELPEDEVSASDAAGEVLKANRARQEKLDEREAREAKQAESTESKSAAATAKK